MIEILNFNYKAQIPDYTKPIFVYGIPVKGLSKAKAEEVIKNTIESYKHIPNMWFTINNDSGGGHDGITCIYQPKLN